MPFALSSTTGAPISLVLKDGSVLVIGEDLEVHRPLFRALLYSAQTGQWRIAAPLPPVGAGFTATLLLSGQVLIAGGLDRAHPTGQAAAYLYSPE
jgi:hypothetical protein